MTYWLIHTNIGYFQFDDEMGAPFHFLSGLLKNCNIISMTPIEAEDPIPAPVEDEPTQCVDVNPHSSPPCGTMDERTHVLGGFNTGDGRWTCDQNCWCKKPTEADEEEAADEHFSKIKKQRQNYPETIDRGPDHCGHCGEQGRRRSKLKKCSHPRCQGHCVDCIDGRDCWWND